MTDLDYTQSESTAQYPESGVDYALRLAALSWKVFPCDGDKRPVKTGGINPKTGEPYRLAWGKKATNDPAEIRRLWSQFPGNLVGIACAPSSLFAVDIDRKDGIDGARSWAELIESHGGGREVIAGPAQLTPSGGWHILFRLPNGIKIPNTAGKLGARLDLRSDGYICSGAGYSWLPGHEPEIPLTDAPAWLLDQIRLLTRPPAAAQPANQQPLQPAQSAGNYWLRYYLERAAVGNRNETGFSLAAQLRDSGIPQLEAESIMAEYARRVPGDGYEEGEALASLRSAYGAPRREPATLPGLRAAGAARVPADLRAAPGRNGHGPEVPENTVPVPEWALRMGSLTDAGNADRLVKQYGNRLRWVFEWGWLVYDGQRWSIDRNDQVVRLAKDTARSIYQEAAHAKDDERSKELASWAGRSLSRTRIEAMIALARSELSARPENFDTDPWLLNCENGILDLRSGELRAHDSEAHLTKLAGTHYDPAASCSTWLKFLDRVFSGDREMIAFLQRAVGYSLTGDMGEQCLFFLYGRGANGKSTFTRAIQDILGEYGMQTRAEALMVRKSESIPEEVAQLAGVRFMLASELGDGQRLNESLIKDLTGGDKLRARLLHQNSFEYHPVAKPWIYGNHRPAVRGTDEGIWRRPHLIGFDVTIPEKERDRHLSEILRTELPGILAWAVRGCLEWQKLGLQPPDSVRTATQAYRAEQDILGAFLDDCCIINDLAIVAAGELYAAYKSWAEDSNVSILSSIAFSRSLEERGYSTKGLDGKSRRDHSAKGRGRAIYTGIGLLDTDKS